MKAKTNKTIKKILAFAVIIFLVLSAAALLSPHFYWHYIYHGDRIKGDIHITKDGENIPLNKISLSAGTHNLTVKGDSLSMHAAEYGSYHVDLDIEGMPIELKFYQYNWWNVCTFDISIDINTENGIISYCGERSNIEESGNIKRDNISGTFAIGEESAEIHLSSV